jgi:hypothetical protein
VAGSSISESTLEASVWGLYPPLVFGEKNNGRLSRSQAVIVGYPRRGQAADHFIILIKCCASAHASGPLLKIALPDLGKFLLRTRGDRDNST